MLSVEGDRSIASAESIHIIIAAAQCDLVTVRRKESVTFIREVWGGQSSIVRFFLARFVVIAIGVLIHLVARHFEVCTFQIKFTCFESRTDDFYAALGIMG